MGGPLGSRALVLGLLVAALMVASPMLTSKPAQADTTFTVGSTSDVGDANLTDNVCDASPFPNVTLCTLPAAIEQANATPGADTIKFNIPGTGVKTISPLEELPNIKEAVTIDGYSQPGSSPNTLAKGTNAKLLIELDGSNIDAFADGLDINASNVTVRGLVINSFNGDPDDAFDDAGIEIIGDLTGVKIEGNFIGTDATGQVDRGNGSDGVTIRQGQGHTVGGAAPDKRNLISGNDRNGVRFDFTIGNSKVHGNLIGTKKDGVSALGNGAGNATGDGINIIGSSNNFIGGTGPGEANTIAFNKGKGVRVAGFGNFVTTGNRILANSIFSNGGLGIDLVGGTENATGATANDTGDTDTGANDLQNKPVITSAKTVGGKTTIQAKLNSTPNDTFSIQFFSNPSGNEGKTFIGSKSVSTNSNGNVTFTFTPSQAVPVGQTVTATALDLGGGNTSEFSGPRTVAAS